MLQESVRSTPRVRARERAETRGPRISIGTLALHLVLIIGAFIMGMPFIWMLLTSLKDFTQAFAYPPTWIPNPVVWQNFPDSLTALPFGRAYFNSVYITLVVVVAQLLTCSMAGYAFARLRFPGSELVFLLFLAMMMVPGQVTVIPLFIMLRDVGWINTHLALIVPPALLNAFGVFLMRQFVRGLPVELEEAAIVDGANRWTIFWRVILPLLRAPLAALGILSFLGQWNNFFMPLIMLNSPNLFTVPLLLNEFRSEYTTQWTLMMAGSVIAVLPVLIIYIVGQRYFIAGIAMTGLKA
jgi:multiple sugar transport system permease protein